jgi:hypothetical protein
MFASKIFQKKSQAEKRNKSIDSVSVPSELLAETQRRHIDMIEREEEIEVNVNLSKWMRFLIRIKLFLIRLWIKIQKQ